jgi:uncharacterized protein YkwD
MQKLLTLLTATLALGTSSWLDRQISTAAVGVASPPENRHPTIIAERTDRHTQTISIALNTAPTLALSRIESELLLEMNRARANPPAYASVLLSWRQQFNGKDVRLSRRAILVTKEGTAAVDEAIFFLRRTRPVSTLRLSRGLTLAARDLIRDRGVRGTTGHQASDGSSPFQRMQRYGKWQQRAGENIMYGSPTARDVVRDLIIDDGVPARYHRTNMFQPQFRLAGVACGYHARYRVMCDIKYAGNFRDRW